MELWRESWSGDPEKVLAALGHGASVNWTDKDGVSGLMLALREGHSEVVALLLRQPGIDVGQKDLNGVTALHMACRYGRTSELAGLLAQPAAVYSMNARDLRGETPLLWAVRSGQETCARLLLRTEGVDTDTRDGEGRSLEEVAREVGHAGVLAALAGALGHGKRKAATEDGPTDGEERTGKRPKQMWGINPYGRPAAMDDLKGSIENLLESSDEGSKAATEPPEDIVVVLDEEAAEEGPGKKQQSDDEMREEHQLELEVADKEHDDILGPGSGCELTSPTVNIDYNSAIGCHLLDPAKGIPTDVTFRIFETCGWEDRSIVASGEVPAHRFVLALAGGGIAHRLLGDAALPVVVVSKTTKEAFQMMIDYIYQKPLDLAATSLSTVFSLTDLAWRFEVPSLTAKLAQHLAAPPLPSTAAALEAAGTARRLHSDHLMDSCAKAVFAGFTDPRAIFTFATEVAGTGQEALGMELLAKMRDYANCNNCSSFPCLRGKSVENFSKLKRGTRVRLEESGSGTVGTVRSKKARTGKATVVTGDGESYRTGAAGLTFWCYCDCLCDCSCSVR